MEHTVKMKECAQCGIVLPLSEFKCPYCGNDTLIYSEETMPEGP